MSTAKHLCAAALALSAASAQALTIEFDYSLDTLNFFTADKRAVLDQVASIFDPNDWAAMGARGWQVLSASPNLYTTVTMPAVPEPAYNALLLAGLAVVGVAARRR